MTNGSCHSTLESNVQTWLNPPRSARAASSATRLHGGSVCSTKPISIKPPSPEVLALAPGQEPALPGLAVPLTITDQDLAAGHHHAGPALYLPALVGGVVHRHVVRLGGQHVPQRRIVDHDVGVRAGGNGSLARVEAEHPRWRGRVHLGPS